jgi:ribosomal protein L37AE/L43A
VAVTCRRVADTYLATDQHFDGCDDPACKGCYPCVPRSDTGDPLEHCAGRNHCTEHIPADVLVCARCVGKIRDALADIEKLHAKMLDEAVHRGVESEAANLAGPATDPEAWSWRKAAALHNGTLAAMDDDDEHHPYSVLGRWDLMIREDYGPPTDALVSVPAAVAYLDGQLDRLANDPAQDFGDFAADVLRCRAHLEAVLHDHGAGDRANVGCFDCGGTLERRLTRHGFDDVWTCRDCGRRYTYAEYNFALRAALEGSGT